MTKQFAVVKFPQEDDSLAVVPLSWLSEDRAQCFWPFNIKGSELLALVEKKAEPDLDAWKTYPVVVLTTCRE